MPGYTNVHDLACALGKDSAYIARTIRLATICPDIVHAILNGILPQNVNLDTLRNTTMDEWAEQKKFVGYEFTLFFLYT